MNEKITALLIRSKFYRDCTKAVREITGLPLSLRPLEAAPAQERRRRSWALLGRKNCRCKSCAKGFVRIVAGIPSRATVIKCTNGCCAAAVPVRCGRDVIALLQVGPVSRGARFRGPALAFDKQAREAGSDAVKSALRAGEFVLVPFSRKQCRAALRLLGVFAEHLGQLCNQILVQKQSDEPRAVTRAKEFISEHYSEEISSKHAAKELRLNRFYFCKLFKRKTGFTFTAYLARVRVERVKELLLNRQLQISEIAFQVGFRSLTHFNRVFLKLTGRSPTEYRALLRAI